jgi:hypothetical protein
MECMELSHSLKLALIITLLEASVFSENLSGGSIYKAFMKDFKNIIKK